MNDLMEEVQEGGAQYEQNGGAVVVKIRDYDGGRKKMAQEGDMPKFFLEVAEIKRLLGVIEVLHGRIHDTHEQSKAATQPEEITDYRELMQKDADKVKKTGHKVQSKLDHLDNLNALALQKEGQGPGSSSERTRSSITAGLKKKLKLQMDKFQRLRLLMQTEYRETIERRVFTITGDHKTDEEIERMIESGESERLFQQALVPRSQVDDTLQEIEERHRAVKDLEQSLLELHQLFIDMSVLIEEQGAILDSVEIQVKRGIEYVKEGTEVLKDARRLGIQGNKYMICVLGVTIAVIIFIATTVGVNFRV